jgi:hypothetical protein
LIHNTFSLAYQGSENYFQASNLANYLGQYENNYVPWKVFIWHINKISQIIEHRPSFKDIRVIYHIFIYMFSDYCLNENQLKIKGILFEFDISIG